MTGPAPEVAADMITADNKANRVQDQAHPCALASRAGKWQSKESIVQAAGLVQIWAGERGTSTPMMMIRLVANPADRRQAVLPLRGTCQSFRCLFKPLDDRG